MQRNFTNLRIKADLLERQGKKTEAEALRAEALPLATEGDMNALGYTHLQAGELDKAIAVFQGNAKKHPGSWNVHDSLAEGQAAAGRKAEAIANYRKALSMAPEPQHARIRGELAKLGVTD